MHSSENDWQSGSLEASAEGELSTTARSISVGCLLPTATCCANETESLESFEVTRDQSGFLSCGAAAEVLPGRFPAISRIGQRE